jgi:hypothetical protein
MVLGGGWSSKVRSLALAAGMALAANAIAACGGAANGSTGVVEAGDEPEIAGVTVVPVASAKHVNEVVVYNASPPAGGDHNPAWQNCGFYTEALVPELVVHSLEHGAVWITYQPDADDETLAAIRALADRHDYVVASPYPNDAAPIVLTAWGRHAEVESADDPLVAEFLDTYLEDGPTTPEPGAACSGAVGIPPDQPTSLIR